MIASSMEPLSHTRELPTSDCVLVSPPSCSSGAILAPSLRHNARRASSAELRIASALSLVRVTISLPRRHEMVLQRSGG